MESGSGPASSVHQSLRNAVMGSARAARMAGAALALAATAGFGMRSLLFEVSPLDPITLFGSVVVITTATIAASLIPAAAAASVEPRAALEG